MNTHPPYTSIVDEVQKRIKQGTVAMRPRWHFVLKAGLGIAGAVILFLATLYLLSFIVFTLHATGVWFIPAFGFRGLGLFLVSLPWLLIALSFVFIALVEVLVQRYSFAYRKPLLFSVAGVILLVVAGSVATANARFHERMWSATQAHRVPLIDPLYRGYVVPHKGMVHPLVVSSTTERGFFAIDRDGDIIEVVISPQTRLPYGFDFTTGDETVILGENADSVIEAMGIAPMRWMREEMRERREELRPGLMHSRRKVK